MAWRVDDIDGAVGEEIDGVGEGAEGLPFVVGVFVGGGGGHEFCGDVEVE